MSFLLVMDEYEGRIAGRSPYGNSEIDPGVNRDPV